MDTSRLPQPSSKILGIATPQPQGLMPVPEHEIEYENDDCSSRFKIKSLWHVGVFYQDRFGCLLQGVNNFVEELDISWNQIRKKGAVMICAGLKVSHQHRIQRQHS